MSDQTVPSEWESERFGDLAVPLRAAIWRALEAAHRRALAGHLGFGLDTNDVYGQMWLIQNAELLKELEQLTSEVRRSKPKRARYELAVVGDNNIILYPWKFSDDNFSPLTGAKMRLSQTRQHLLGLTPKVSDQLTFDHAELTEEQLEAEFQDMEQFLDDAAAAGRLVVIAYASNRDAGVLRVYWGDASYADDSGHLQWDHMEEIARPAADTGEATGDRPVRPAGPTPRPQPAAAGRFDQAPMGEIALTARTPLTAPDGGAPPTPRPETGSDDA